MVDEDSATLVGPPDAVPKLAAGDEFDLSVIIVNRNTRDLLAACLASLARLPDELRFEVVVVDNASEDGSPQMVSSRFPDVRLIKNDSNTGFAAPNNQGIAASRGRYVMLLNSDTEVAPHALERLVSFMDQHPDAGACGPLLRYPDGRPQASWLSFHSPWRSFCDMSGLAALFPRNALFANQERLFDPRSVQPVETLMGAAIVVRREVVNAIGLIDERFRIHCNETDWCLRMKQAGWNRMFVPHAEVLHHLGGTLRSENESLRLQGEMIQNLFDYHRKHYGRAGLAWFRLMTVIGYGARLLWSTISGRDRRSSAPDVRLFWRGMLNAALSGDPHRFGHPGER